MDSLKKIQRTKKNQIVHESDITASLIKESYVRWMSGFSVNYGLDICLFGTKTVI